MTPRSAQLYLAFLSVGTSAGYVAHSSAIGCLVGSSLACLYIMVASFVEATHK